MRRLLMKMFEAVGVAVRPKVQPNLRNMRPSRLRLRQFLTCMIPLVATTVIIFCMLWQWGSNESRWSTAEKTDKFEQVLIKANTNMFGVTNAEGLLDIYGLRRRMGKSDTWRKLEMEALAAKENLHFVSPVTFDSKQGPQFELAESLSGHIQETLREHQWFVASHIVELQNAIAELPDSEHREALRRKLIQLSTHSMEYNRILRKELAELRWRTGHAQSSQRVLSGLKKKIRDAIERMQAYPCSKAFKCVVTDPYGFASGIHLVLWCIVKGILEDRRVIIDTRDWHYTNKGTSWEKMLQSMGIKPGENCGKISGLPDPARHTILYDIPKDIAKPLVQHHPKPYAWWLAQLVGYIMRPTNFTESLLQQMKAQLGFKAPIVGIQVRRTDKFTEGAYHVVEEYMAHVEEYYRSTFGADVIEKRVFVATDEPEVVVELRKKFPDFVFISNTKSTDIAHSLDTRYAQGAFETVVTDLLLLSQTDKLICTLSSGICRIAYELMLAHREEPTDDFMVSLDVGYYFAYKLNPPQKAIYAHEPLEPSEMHVSVGDCIESPYPRFVDIEATKKGSYDGFSTGSICHSKGKLMGMYPTYKTIPTVVSTDKTITS